MNSIQLSVVVCAYNPQQSYINEVLISLKNQTLNTVYWELIFIDNKSDIPLSTLLDISWHPNSRFYREERLGLVYGRIASYEQSNGDIIVTVDDDTPLEKTYLENVVKIYNQYPEMGIIGGRTIPRFEIHPPIWLPEFYSCLAIRDLGENILIQQLSKNEKLSTYPVNGPLLIAPKKEALRFFIEELKTDQEALILGRKGNDLASGEDNHIVLSIYKAGYKIGYFPELKFEHIIPAKRMTKEYLSRLNFSMSKTWIKVLEMNGINLWQKIPKWTLNLRKFKAYFSYKAWQSKPNYIKWRGACGMFEGLVK